jgi:hypothetical protein
MENGRGWMAAALLTVLAIGACGSSTPATTHDGGPADHAQTGSVTEGCMYTVGVLSCQTWTGTQSVVTGEIKACESVFGGAAVASCPTTGVLGTCINITTDSLNETSVIYYYQNDAGVLSLPDLCDSSMGTYAPVN